MKAVIRRIERMLTNPAYLSGLRSSGKNWLDISDDEVIEKDLAFIKSI